MIGAGVVERATDAFADSLPRLAAGLLLLVGGLIAAWLLGLLAGRALRRVGLDELAARFGITDALERFGFQRSLSRLVGRAIRIALSVVVLMAALAALGLRALSRSLNEAVLFLPKLFVAFALVLVGVVAGDFLRRRVDRVADQMALELPLGRIVQIAVVAILVLSALAQLGVPTQIVTAAAAVVLVSGALTLTLAFGLGSRDVARELSAGRYVSRALELGQRISVEGARGEIVAFDAAAVVLRSDDGSTLRVPNHVALASVVTVEAQSAEPT